MATKKKTATTKKTSTKKSQKKASTPKIKPGTVLLRYSSNNSGGSWWLTDNDWLALEKAGWKVEWRKNMTGFGSADKTGRWLGALATSASKVVASADEGIKEWESITGQDPWAEGCNCCGNPHGFSYEDDKGHSHYASIRTTSRFGGWS